MPDEPLTEDILFLACTRPAMLLGVPLEAMSVNMILTGLIFLAGGTPLYLLSGVVLHFLFRAIVKNDHNAFRVLFIWFDTKARARNAGWWGGSSIAPLPMRRRYRPEEVAHG